MKPAIRLLTLTFVLGAAASFAIAQEAATVTFSSRAVPVTRLLVDYAAATGKKVRAAPVMEKEIAVVRLAGADHADFTRRLAAAVAGRWTTEGDEQVLVPDEAARAAEARKELADRAAEIRKAVQQRVDARQGAGGGGIPSAQMAADVPFGAGEDLITAFLQAADPVFLAKIKRGERLVFSSAPNAMQRPLPTVVWPHVAKVVAENNRSAEAQKEVDEQGEAKTDAEVKMEAYLRKLGIDPDGRRPRKITEAPSKVIVAVQRQPMMGGGLSVAATLYDASGRVLTQVSDMFAFESGPGVPEVEIDPETGEAKAPPPDVKVDPSDPVVVLSEESRAVRDLGRGWSDDEEDAKEPAPEVLAKLRRPDLYDPLSFGDSEALLFVAEKRKKNLIAALPDRHLYVADKGTIGTFLAGLGPANGFELADADGWMVLKSTTPGDDRQQRAPRGALARLIGAHESKGYASLDDLAAFALASPGDGTDEITMQALERFVSAATSSGFEGPQNYDELRLFGSLSATQRMALRDGGQVPFSALAGKARESLIALLFGARLSLGAPQAVPESEDPLAEMLVGLRMAFSNEGGIDYRSEPTEAMPRGLPADGFLAADVRVEPVGMLGKDAGKFGLPVAGGSELGMFLYIRSDPKYQAIIGDMPDPGPMTLGERTRWHLRLVVSPGIEAVCRFSDSRPVPGAAKFTLQALPANLKAITDRTVAFMKANPLPFFDPEMFGSGRGVPPPRP
ncbi:MAG: hypothetical protein KIS66_08315 [Fimbriimonadaceae bacterium]|nr:hypothetical protein [Fimbriimonadaceae bacterium]